MTELDTPIFKKTYDLYKLLYSYRTTIPKSDRYGIWQKCETATLNVLEDIMLAGQKYQADKLPTLNETSQQLNLARVFIRLAKEVRAIDIKKYTILQTIIDEIGRMLGGWIRSLTK